MDAGPSTPSTRPRRPTVDRRTFGSLAALAPAAALSRRSGPSPSVAPLVIPAVHGSGARLVTVGNPGRRLTLKGVIIWGIPDYITAAFAPAQFTNRYAICAAVAAWGGNHIRLRVLADEWVHLRHIHSRATYLAWIRNWVAAAKAHGLYTYISWWDCRDSSDGSTSGPHWATRYDFAFPMMAAVHKALRLADGQDEPSVFYEPFNEPADVSWGAWLAAMEATVELWRSRGYQGVLVLDTPDYSHEYSDEFMTLIEAYDSRRTRSRRHNLVFARHDYCTDYPAFRFDPVRWCAASGGTETRHVLLESEFGNFNQGFSSLPWSQAITQYFKVHGFARSNVAGMTAFVFGNWYDPNAMSIDPAGRRPTSWGTAVRSFLG